MVFLDIAAACLLFSLQYTQKQYTQIQYTQIQSQTLN